MKKEVGKLIGSGYRVDKLLDEIAAEFELSYIRDIRIPTNRKRILQYIEKDIQI